VSLACGGLMFASVLVCGSRAGTGIVVAEVLIFLVAACLGHQRNLRAAGLILATFAACTLIGGWTHIWERFAAGNYLASRSEILTSTINMFARRPWTGFGLGTWPHVYPAFAVFDPPGVYMNHAHNDWAEWAAEGGIPLLAILAVFGCMVSLNVRAKLWTIGIPAVLAHALVDFPLQKPAIACALFFFAGLAFTPPYLNEPKVAAESDSSELQLP
jgi:O-antigen ligase